MSRTLKYEFILVLAVIFLMQLSGCIKAEPMLMPEYMYATPTPIPTPEPTPMPVLTATPVSTLRLGYDAMGNFIVGETHFWRYLLFKNILVYEQAEDTFLNGLIVNEYCEPLTAELFICFYESEEEVARGHIRTSDGTSNILTLVPGENRIWAQINTDMALTALEFEFVETDQNKLSPLQE